MSSIFDFFIDPLFFASTMGAILMCLGASLVGTIVFVRRKTLIGEALSHASYPGVVIGVLLASFFLDASHESMIYFVFFGALIFSLVAFFLIEKMQKQFHVKGDASLCFILSSFLGVGILLGSRMQYTHPIYFRNVQTYIYGQAATMRDSHVVVYAFFTLLIILFIGVFFKQLQAINFDSKFSKALGLPTRFVEMSVAVLLSLSIVIGIRSVGVVLMSGMLVMPAAAARCYTNKLSKMFVLSGIIGVLSGFFGNYLSFLIPNAMAKEDMIASFSLPTGPMIILVAAVICFGSLLFSPKRGVLFRFIRSVQFKNRCLLENILKYLWKNGGLKTNNANFVMIKQSQNLSLLRVYYLISKLQMEGYIYKHDKGRISLSKDGFRRAAHIIRLHRLWEVYLYSYLGIGEERVHRNAEEMEHIITDELEIELTKLLNDPKLDPHNKPIPQKERM